MAEGELKRGISNEKLTWFIAVAAFTILNLWPIWSVRFPSMQDYPQHISQVQILSEYYNPDYDYSEYFTASLKPAPYATFYAITLFLTYFLTIEIAGKATISVYILLITLISLKISLQMKRGSPPWGILLLFPFAFNQQYFLGYMNYLLSLPLLLLALMDQKNLIKGQGSFRPLLINFLWMTALFFTHPFTFLVYIFLSFINITLYCREPNDYKWIIPHILLAILLFSVWFFTANPVEVSTFPSKAKGLFWIPFNESFVYYLYIFTGMLWYDGPDRTLIYLWSALAALIVLSSFGHKKRDCDYPFEYFVFFAIITIAIFLLPFAKWVFTYINLRLTAVSYFFLALAAGRVNFRGISKVVFIVILSTIMIHSVVKQRNISNEIEEIKPLLEKIPPKSSILPLIFDNDSPELDSRFFDPHLHNHDYYYILTGGGLSPYIPDSPLLPVHFKPGLKPPAPGDYVPHLFKWELHGSYYDYFLIRGLRKGILSYMSEKAVLLDRSGKWLLFKKKY